MFSSVRVVAHPGAACRTAACWIAACWIAAGAAPLYAQPVRPSTAGLELTFQPDPNGKKKSKYPSDLEVVLCNLDKKADNPCKVSKNERFDRPTQFFIVFMTEERRRGKFSKGVVEASLWLLDSTTGEEIEIAKGSRTLDPETGIFVDFPPPAELLQLSPPVGETSIEQHLERSSGRFVVRLKFSGMRKLKRNQDSYRLLMGFVEPDPVR